MNKNYKIEMETLTPVHIGSGEKAIFGLDYYLEGTKVIFIDLPELIEAVNKEEMERLSRSIKQMKIKDIKFMVKKYGKELYTIENKADTRRREIDTILKTHGGYVYIPGSSLKGAIRTSLIYDRIGEEEEKRKISGIAKHERISKKIANEKISDIEGAMESILKKNVSGKEIDMLSSLIIRDSEVKKVDECTSVCTLNISISEGAFAHSQLIEVINPNVKFEGKISIKGTVISIEKIKDAANKFASAIIGHEKKIYGNYLKWWSRKEGIKTESLLKIYENLGEEMENLGKNDFLLNLGRHSGHHIKTGWSTFDELLFDKGTSEEIADLLRIKFPPKKKKVREPFPKTRRAIMERGNLKPLGWVKVRVYEN